MSAFLRSKLYFYFSLFIALFWLLIAGPLFPYYFGYQDYLDANFVPTEQCPKVTDCDTGGTAGIFFGLILLPIFFLICSLIAKFSIRPWPQEVESLLWNNKRWLISILTLPIIFYSIYGVFEGMTTSPVVSVKVADSSIALFTLAIVVWYRQLALSCK